MYKLSKLICLIVLCCFAFTATAGTLRCCDEIDIADTMQFPADTSNAGCHTDKKNSSDDNCCQDMNLCHSSVSFVSNLQLETVQIIKQSVQLPANEHIVLSIASPPVRPPKLIN